MSNNTYQDVVTQAWTTYTSTQTKYRTKDYLSLLEPAYKAFVEQLAGIDGVVAELGSTKPPSDNALKNAEQFFNALQASLNAMANVIASFADMDRQAINKAAVLDQAALTKTYDTVEEADRALLTTFTTTLVGAQQSAAQAMGIFETAPK